MGTFELLFAVVLVIGIVPDGIGNSRAEWKYAGTSIVAFISVQCRVVEDTTDQESNEKAELPTC